MLTKSPANKIHPDDESCNDADVFFLCAENQMRVSCDERSEKGLEDDWVYEGG